MEELLPFLAGLAYMAYKFYTNFQKGQEEARQRDPSRPYYEEPVDSHPEWSEPDETYIPQTVKKEAAAEKYHEPKYEPAYKEPMIQRPVREPLYKEAKTTIPQKVELHNPELPSEEVRRGRAIHQPHKHQFEASHEQEETYSDFDFEDAIIKEAILNRPQY